MQILCPFTKASVSLKQNCELTTRLQFYVGRTTTCHKHKSFYLIRIFQAQIHTQLKKLPHPTPMSASGLLVTPPHPIWRFRKFNERFQLLIWPWPGGGGARPWPSGAWDEESGADLDRGRTRTWGARTQRHFLRPQRHLAMAWRRRRQAMAK